MNKAEKIVNSMLVLSVIGLAFGLGMKFQKKRGAR